MKKADVLFLLVGTNPIPNIISALYRVKDSGKLYFLYTKGDIGEGTESIAKKLQEVVLRKRKDLITDLVDISNTEDTEIENKLTGLTDHITEKDIVIELNYTGGTKVMSSVAYNYFINLARKNINKIVNLTYLDNEKRKFIVETFHKNEKDVKIKSLNDIVTDKSLTIKEISEIHCVDIDYDEPKLINKEACTKIFNKIVDENSREETIKLLESYYDKVKKIKSISKLEELKEKEDPFSEIYTLLEVENDYKNIGFEDGFEELSALEYFKGFWLEDYILNLLFINKEKWGISEIAHSIKNNKNVKNKKFEVDLVIRKNNNTYFLSVSTIDYKEGVLNKLYEVSYRSVQLAGNSGKIGVICLNKSSKEIEDDYMRFWESSQKKKYMIVQLDKLQDLEEEIEAWIS